jgi:hypothetical protein
MEQLKKNLDYGGYGGRMEDKFFIFERCGTYGRYGG